MEDAFETEVTTCKGVVKKEVMAALLIDGPNKF